MVDIKNEEILTCFLLIVVGYCIAKMFSRSCNGFSVSVWGEHCSDYNLENDCNNDNICKWSNTLLQGTTIGMGKCINNSQEPLIQITRLNKH